MQAQLHGTDFRANGCESNHPSVRAGRLQKCRLCRCSVQSSTKLWYTHVYQVLSFLPRLLGYFCNLQVQSDIKITFRTCSCQARKLVRPRNWADENMATNISYCFAWATQNTKQMNTPLTNNLDNKPYNSPLYKMKFKVVRLTSKAMFRGLSISICRSCRFQCRFQFQNRPDLEGRTQDRFLTRSFESLGFNWV